MIYMKKISLLIITLLAGFCALGQVGQKTYSTTTPTSTNSLPSVNYRYSAITPDSLNQLWIYNPLTSRYNRFYSATEANKLFAPLVGGGYVPYTGATGTVDLGTNTFYAGTGIFTGNIASNSLNGGMVRLLTNGTDIAKISSSKLVVGGGVDNDLNFWVGGNTAMNMSNSQQVTINKKPISPNGALRLRDADSLYAPISATVDSTKFLTILRYKNKRDTIYNKTLGNGTRINYNWATAHPSANDVLFINPNGEPFAVGNINYDATNLKTDMFGDFRFTTAPTVNNMPLRWQDTTLYIDPTHFNTLIGTATATALAAKVPNTRLVSTGNGLLGGGNLGSNLTLSADTGTLVSLNRFNTTIGAATANAIATKVSTSSFNSLGDARYLQLTGGTLTGNTSVSYSTNGDVSMNIVNPNSGASAYAFSQLSNGTSALQMFHSGTGNPMSGVFAPNRSVIMGTGVNGLLLSSLNGNTFFNVGGTNVATVSSTGLDIAGTGTFSSRLFAGVASPTQTAAGVSSTSGIQSYNEVFSGGPSAGIFWGDRSNTVTPTANWYGWYSIGGATNFYNGSNNVLSISNSGVVTGGDAVGNNDFVTKQQLDGKVQNSLTASTTVAPSATAVNTGLALKEDASNKSTSTSLGNSNTLYPSQNAVKVYADGNFVNNSTTQTGLFGAKTWENGHVFKAGIGSGSIGTVGSYAFNNGANGISVLQSASGVTAGKIWTLPNNTGTVALTSDIPTNANFVDLTTNQTVAGNKTWSGNNSYTNIRLTNGGNTGIINTSPQTLGRTWSFQDKSGEIAMVSDVPTAGQTTLTAGVSTITIPGLTTSSIATTGFVSIGGTVSTTWQYKAVCTTNTLTITAITNANTTNTTDTSILNYSVKL